MSLTIISNLFIHSLNFLLMNLNILPLGFGIIQELETLMGEAVEEESARID